MERYYEYNGDIYKARIESVGDHIRVIIGERIYLVEGHFVEAGRLRFRIEAHVKHLEMLTARHERDRYIAWQGRQYRLRRLAGQRRRHVGAKHQGNLEAQMPGQVIQVLVSEGEAVHAGQPLVILEAMKMELRVVAPIDGVVIKLFCRPGDSVERGQKLVELRGLDEEDGGQT